MIHAQLDVNNICSGYGDLKRIESHPFLVYLPDGWNEDLLWRKYVDGQWSAEKYPPSQPEPGVSLEEQINTLKQRDSQMQQDISLILEFLGG